MLVSGCGFIVLIVVLIRYLRRVINEFKDNLGGI